MSLSTLEGAEKKFWRLPELVEMLIPFLDGPSTLSLVKACPLALEIIQRKSMWIKLVRRVCPYMVYDVLEWVEYEEEVAKDRSAVMNLVQFLKMMENPVPRLLDLLHVICERFPPVDRDDVPLEARKSPSSVNVIPGPEFIQVSCTCGDASHDVFPQGFLYLEEAERAMGTTEQKVERVVLDDLEEPCLEDLESRLLRQRYLGVDTTVDVAKLICNSKESAEAISNLMQHCQRVDVQISLVNEVDLGVEGWAALGKAFSWIPGNTEKCVDWVDSSKVDMASARREDLKAILEGVGGWSIWLDEKRSQSFQDWNLFEKCLDGVETGVPIHLFNGEEDVAESEDEDGNEDNDV